MHVLIVEDDPQFGRMLERRVAKLKLEPLRATNLPEARRLFDAHPVRLVILDRMLEDGGDSLGFCLELKKDPRTRAVPVVVLTGLEDLPEQLKSYRFGADLFLTKNPETLPRLEQFLRTFLERLPYAAEAGGRIAFGPLALDLNERTVAVAGREHKDLPPGLFDLLALLVARQGGVATRGAIVKRLWDRPVRDKDVDLMVHRLKARLPELAALIEAVRGEGYRLRAGTGDPGPGAA